MNIREARAVIHRKIEQLKKEREALFMAETATGFWSDNIPQRVIDDLSEWEKALRYVDEYIKENNIP